MNPDSSDDLTTRVARLERSSRVWRNVALAAGIAATALAASAYRNSPATTVDAQRIVLHGARGARAVELSVDGRGQLRAAFQESDSSKVLRETRRVGIVILDENGKEVAHLGAPIPAYAAP